MNQGKVKMNHAVQIRNLSCERKEGEFAPSAMMQMYLSTHVVVVLRWSVVGAGDWLSSSALSALNRAANLFDYVAAGQSVALVLPPLEESAALW